MWTATRKSAHHIVLNLLDNLMLVGHNLKGRSTLILALLPILWSTFVANNHKAAFSRTQRGVLIYTFSVNFDNIKIEKY